ncbi:MAG: signal peptide peptidase SppA [Myxococcota bacterium]|nr:signal peptide peptidase SppA [Myxococcota bacterium]
MDRRATWVLGIVFGGLFLCLFGFLALIFMAVQGGGSRSGASLGVGARVGVIEVVGPIMDSRQFLDDLRAFEEAGHIKAIVIRVDSPGGGVAPSQEMYEAIKRARQTKKIYSSMGSLAASGGYYIAAATEKIYANPGTMTGSIGVIMQQPNVEGLLRWAGVSMNTLTAGKLKDSGSPFRAMTSDERSYLELMLKDVHEQFIAAVANGRGLEVEEVRPHADGRVFTGRQAKDMKLVDELGGLQDAVTELGRSAGMKGTPEVEYPARKRKFLEELLGEEANALMGGAARALGRLEGPSLEYRIPLSSP